MLTDHKKEAADFNGDGVINIIDVLVLYKAVAGNR